jgi:hypothetical protein
MDSLFLHQPLSYQGLELFCLHALCVLSRQPADPGCVPKAALGTHLAF